MLYPIRNQYRQWLDLSGFWDFQPDLEDRGQKEGWHTGLGHPRLIAVPASWNDQFEDLRDFLGPAWYSRQFGTPWGWENSRIFLRFNSVNYLAQVWLNGQELGRHEGGHLPFIFDITENIKPLDNTLVLRVDGRLAGDRVPPGNVTGSDLDFFPSHSENYPQTQFDFFPYCGIQRPVLLYCQPKIAVDDITVLPELVGSHARLWVSAGSSDADIRATLKTNEGELFEAGTGEVRIDVRDPRKWSPGDPFLYDLTVELLYQQRVVDAYSLPIGIRTIAVDGDQLLLNNVPIYLQGFGRHEDFPVSGRGLNSPVIVKDYALMRWIGANSFRTSHYPYSEQMMALADRLGYLVIDETPAVGLFFNTDGYDRRLALCKQFTREMILRDKNHPSVIAWSLANEPHSTRDAAKPFFRELYDQAKSLDPSRPITLVSCMGVAEESFEFLDFMCLNRYFGWYQESAQIDRGTDFLSAELDLLHETYRKPLILTEFGADALPGHHAHPPEMFSEEFQADFLEAYIAVLRSKSYVVGEHVWNMCDFKTSQGITRMGGLNHKGVFTRDRRPKLAAHRLRKIWKTTKDEG
ncbi:MAG: beta-glucuronidase [Brevefilum sp.]